MVNRLKTILPILLLICFPNIALAAKSDAYIGAGVGITNSTYTLTTEANTFAATNMTDAAYLTSATTNVAGTIFAGYGINWDRFYYLGFQLGGFGGRRRAFFKAFSESRQSTAQDFADSDTNIKLNAYEFDADLRPGIYVQPNTLLYGIIGAAFNKLKLISNIGLRFGTTATSAIFIKSVRKVYLRLGFGFQKYLTHNLSLFFDYIYTNYERLGVGTNNLRQPCDTGTCTFTSQSDALAKDKTFLVGIIYHFLNPVSSHNVFNDWSDGFNGFYIGAEGGLSLMVTKAQLSLQTGQLATNILPFSLFLGAHPHSTDGMGGLFLGFSHLWNRFYFGLEAGSDYSEQRDKVSILRTNIRGGGTLEEQQISSDTDIELGPVSYFFDIKPGFLLTKNAALYVRLGVGVNKIRTTTNALADDFVTPGIAHGELNLFSKKFKVGARVGLGIEGMLTRHLSLRADYIYAYYGSFSDSGSNAFTVNTGTMTGTTNLSDISTQTALVGLIYHFG